MTKGDWTPAIIDTNDISSRQSSMTMSPTKKSSVGQDYPPLWTSSHDVARVSSDMLHG